jgi:hypothetical protein
MLDSSELADRIVAEDYVRNRTMGDVMITAGPHRSATGRSSLRQTAIAVCLGVATYPVSLAVALPRLSAQENCPPATQEQSAAPASPSSARDGAAERLLEEFQRTYALPDDKVVKRVPAPYVPGRLAFYRVHDAEQARIIPEGPEVMLFRWDQRTPNPLPTDWPGEGRLSEAEIGWFGGHGSEVAHLVESFTGICPYEMQGDWQLLQTGVSGDWVIRDGVAPKKLLHGLQTALRLECQLPVRFRLVQKDCQVIVATGQYTFQPLPGNADYTDEAFLPWDRIDVYEKDRSTVTEEGGGTLDDVFDIVARFINRPVVNEVSQLPQNSVCWRWSARRYHEARKRGDVDEPAILKHVSEQTGLTFTETTRTVRVLLVQRAE